ncbi:uncharacterized protein LOC119691677 [Plutella xylostella]|uniref:uncharacterized protein LOC119691677 n=1 Tax=Plutella xylostella TaxID=51655 RepID=UPI00203290D9|nr:uncharacterized protein LOC119691677 [Plutella xylostella]
MFTTLQTEMSNKQLRRLWMNIKQRQRDGLTRERQRGQRVALTRQRQYRLGTGGGPSICDPAIDPDVSQVAPALIVGIENAMETDTTQENTHDGIFIDSQPVSETTYESPSLHPYPNCFHTQYSCGIGTGPPSSVTTGTYSTICSNSTTTISCTIFPKNQK